MHTKDVHFHEDSNITTYLLTYLGYT